MGRVGALVFLRYIFAYFRQISKGDTLEEDFLLKEQHRRTFRNAPGRDCRGVSSCVWIGFGGNKRTEEERKRRTKKKDRKEDERTTVCDGSLQIEEVRGQF